MKKEEEIRILIQKLNDYEAGEAKMQKVFEERLSDLTQ